MSHRTARAAATYVATPESNKALGLLLEARGEDNVSPMPIIAPSACMLLQRNGWTASRASYILQLLVESGVIRRVEHSFKYVILRADLYIKDFPEPVQPVKPLPTPRDLANQFASSPMRENGVIRSLNNKLSELHQLVEETKGLLAAAEGRANAAEAEAAELREQLASVQKDGKLLAWAKDMETWISLMPQH